MSDIDQNKPRLWSNVELNSWLTQALTAEREEIRKLTTKGMTATLDKNMEAVADVITKTVNSMDETFEEVATAIKKLNDRVNGVIDNSNINTKAENRIVDGIHQRLNKLEASLAELKLTQAKLWG